MKRLNVLLLSTLLTIGFHSVTYAQLADITEGCPPLRVNLTAPAGATTFFWDLGDGTPSTQRNPIKTYTNPGTYIVRFSLVPNGPVLATDTVNVYPRPSISFTADPTGGCVPLTVNFQDASTVHPSIVVTGYSWTFGAGAQGAGANVSHTYNVPGSYSVSLEIQSSTPGCTNKQDNPNLINATSRPNPRISTDPATPSACAPPLNVTFSNNTPGTNLTYLWNFGNGNTSTLQDPPAQTYTATGSFTATLTATNSAGCSGTAQVVVNIGSPVSNFVIPDTVCAGDTILVSNLSSAGLYFWEFGPGADPLTSSARNPSVTFWNEGLTTVRLRVTDPSGLCQKDTTMVVFVDALDATFTADPTYSCSEPFDIKYTPNSSEPISYFWQFSDGTTSSEMSPTHTWVNPDMTVYSINGRLQDTTTLTVLNEFGCKGFSILINTIHLPNALFEIDSTMGCAPLTVNFKDKSTSNEPIVRWTYLWEDGSSDTFGNNDPVTHTFNQPGEYPVRLIIENAAGCLDTSYAIVIEVGGPITPDFTVDRTTVCQGDTVRFSSLNNDPRIDAWHYATDNDRMSHCPNEPNPTWVYTSEAGPMDVSLTVLYNGCATTVNKDDLITVQGPVAKMDYLIACERPLEVQFFDSLIYEATAVKWYFGDGDSSDLRNPVHSYDAPGDYVVVLVASNDVSGCADSRDTVTVHIRQIKADFTLEPDYCIGLPFNLDASKSEGVNANCWKGFTWFFTDNRPITTQDSVIEYAFTGRGPQEVRLVVEDVNGCRDTLIDSTKVYQAFAVFEADPTRICNPMTVSFTDQSFADTTIVEWIWKFGDGVESGEQNPSHTYNTPPLGGTTNYVVNLIVRDELGCTGELNVPISYYQPFSSVSISDQSLCVGDRAVFEASDFTQEGSFLNFEWFLNNNLISDQQKDTFQFNIPGNFSLKVEYVEEATGCRGDQTVNVQVQAYPNPAFTTPFDNNPLICANKQVQFTAANNIPGTRYHWDFGNGSILTETGGIVGESYADKGTYTVTLVAETSFGCKDTFRRDYTFVLPEGSLGADPTAICKDGTVQFRVVDPVDVTSYRIEFGDGTFAENTSPVSHQYTDYGRNGGRTATLILYQDIGTELCPAVDSIRITIAQTLADFSTDQPIYCPGQDVIFTNSSDEADSFLWSFGDNTTSQSSDPVHSFGREGIYQVTLVARNAALGCADTIMKTVNVTGGIVANLEVEKNPICQGDTTVISVLPDNPDLVYSWRDNGAFIGSLSGSIVEINPAATNTFTVRILDPVTGCRDTLDVVVNVLTPPSFQGDSIAILVKQETENVPLPPLPGAAAGFAINWQPGANLNLSDPLRPIVNNVGTMTETYIATVQSPEGCFPREFIRVVRVFVIPNVFTPDGDETNDFFNLVTEGELSRAEVLRFQIFNRWGQLVYNNESTGQGWNGEHNGKAAPSDVYVYVIEVQFADGSTQVLSGDVTLLR